jgi:hypothetical protein
MPWIPSYEIHMNSINEVQELQCVSKVEDKTIIISNICVLSGVSRAPGPNSELLLTQRLLISNQEKNSIAWQIQIRASQSKQCLEENDGFVSYKV